MNCSKCGAQISDSASFCGKCGIPLKQTTQASVLKTSGTSVTPQQNNDQGTAVVQRTSGFAIASLVLGILAFGILAIRTSLFSFLSLYLLLILVFIIAISATTLGAIAIHQTGKNSNHRGRDLAIAGLCLGIIAIVLEIVSIVGFNQL